MNTRTFLLTGAQGSGKGTQSALLRDVLAKDGSVFYYESGRYFRELLQGEGYTSALVRESINTGAIQPDFLATSLFTETLKTHLTGNEHLIIEGYPRTHAQVETFDEIMEFYKRDTVTVIHLILEESESIRRLVSRARPDDTLEGITSRLAWYREKSMPILTYCKKNPRYTVIDIDGSGSVEDVHASIIKSIGL